MVADRAPHTVVVDFHATLGRVGTAGEAHVALAGDRSGARLGRVRGRDDRVRAGGQRRAGVVRTRRLAVQRVGRPAGRPATRRHRPRQIELHARESPRVVGQIGAQGDHAAGRRRQVHDAAVRHRRHVGIRRVALRIHRGEARHRPGVGIVAAGHREPHGPGPGVPGARRPQVERTRDRVGAVRQRPPVDVAGRDFAEQRERRAAVAHERRRARPGQRQPDAADVQRAVDVDANVHAPRGRCKVHRRAVGQGGHVEVGRAVDEREAAERRGVAVRHLEARHRQRRTRRAAEVRLGVRRRGDRVGARRQRSAPLERRGVRGVGLLHGTGEVEAHAAHRPRARGVRPDRQRPSQRPAHLRDRARRQHRDFPPARGVHQRQRRHRHAGFARRPRRRERHRARRPCRAAPVRIRVRRRGHRIGAGPQAAAARPAVQRVGRAVAHAGRGRVPRQGDPHAAGCRAGRHLRADVERPRRGRIQIQCRAGDQFHHRRAVAGVDQRQPPHRNPRGRVFHRHVRQVERLAGRAATVRARVRRRAQPVGSRRQRHRPRERRAVGVPGRRAHPGQREADARHRPRARGGRADLQRRAELPVHDYRAAVASSPSGVPSAPSTSQAAATAMSAGSAVPATANATECDASTSPPASADAYADAASV